MKFRGGSIVMSVLAGGMILNGGCDPVVDAPEANDGQSDMDGFRDASVETGLIFEYFNGATGEFFFPEIMGAGAALSDFDNDGDLDVFMVQGDFLDDREQPDEPPSASAPDTRNKLFRNALVPSGELRFTVWGVKSLCESGRC